MIDVWADVVGQDAAVAQLRGATSSPVHAYLFVGPPGSGRRSAARAFAAEVLAAGEPDEAAADRHRRLALAEQHPDLTVVERKGASIPVGDREHPEEGSARWVVQRASLSPVDASRSVYVLLDFHLVRDAAAVLLKTIEEPPRHVVFVVVADEITPELVTIASRCVQVHFHAIPPSVIGDQLVAEGVDPALASASAAAALGSIDRARLLVGDPRLGVRRDAWLAVPDRIDGSGSAAAEVAAELAATIDDAQAPLDQRHRAELDELTARVAVTGERGSGRKDMEARHRREARRLRNDELRFGFSTLSQRYRDELASDDPRAALAALGALRDAAEALDRNPNEGLLLQALMLRLTPLSRVG
jgi:DNA polymerase-3 subunit delta'